MTNAAMFDRSEFDLPEGIVYAFTGSEAPFMHRISERWRRFGHLKSRRGAAEIEAEFHRAQALVSRLWNVDVDEIGFPSSVAEGVSMVAESFHGCAGDNVVVDINEYPSLVGPFAMQPGLELRLGSGNHLGKLAELIDQRTKVIAVSHVSYLTGERVDLAAVRALANSVGAMLVVDYTRASGYLPIDASIADFAFAGTYKWMLGTSGVAVAYWNRARQPDWIPKSIGGRSLVNRSVHPDYTNPLPQRSDAVRFTRGSPSHPSLFALVAATDYLLGFEVSKIEAHVESLCSTFLTGLLNHGIPTTTPVPSARRGATVCIESSAGRDIVEQLAKRGVYASHVRGRIRFGFHGYNNMSDVDRALSELRDLWRE